MIMKKGVSGIKYFHWIQPLYFRKQKMTTELGKKVMVLCNALLAMFQVHQPLSGESVLLSEILCGWGCSLGYAWWGACMVGDMHGQGCVWQGTCVAGGMCG